MGKLHFICFYYVFFYGKATFYPEKVFHVAEERQQWRHGQWEWDRPPKHVAVVFWLGVSDKNEGRG